MLSFTKVVRVQNSKIGYANLAIMVILICATVTTGLLYGFHLERATFTGSATVQAVNLPGDGCISRGSSDCEPAFSDKALLPYCAESALPYDGMKLPCGTMTSSFVNQGNSHFQNGALLPSRVGLLDYELQHDLYGPGGERGFEGELEKLVSATWRYEAEVERYWIYVTHNGVLPGTDELVYGGDLEGSYGRAGKERLIEGARSKLDTASRAKGGSTPDSRRPQSALEKKSITVSGSGKLQRERGKTVHAPSPGAQPRPQPQAPQESAGHRRFHDRETPGIIKTTYGDTLQVRTLLKLASLSLDDKVYSDRPSNRTNRYCGVDLRVEIDYTNEEAWPGLKITPWRTNKIRYRYNVVGRRKPSCQYFDPLSVPAVWKEGDHRNYSGFTGIKVDVHVGGTIYQWGSWKTCMTLTFVITVLKIQQLLLETVLSSCTSWFRPAKYETVDREDNAAPEAELLLPRSDEHA